MITNAVRKTVRSLGFDVIRSKANTNETWLSLRKTPFQCVIDVGANNGEFAGLAVQAFPMAEIHCFEPQPKVFEELKAFASKIGRERVHCYLLGLGDCRGELEFNLHPDHTTSSSFLSTTEITRSYCPAVTRVLKQTVNIEMLDNVLPDSALDRKPVLLKLDVQGFEDRVLRGAKKTLERIDAAMIEVGFAQLYNGQAKFIDIVTILDAAGLSYAGNMNQIYHHDGSVLWTDCIFVRNSGGKSKLH